MFNTARIEKIYSAIDVDDYTVTGTGNVIDRLNYQSIKFFVGISSSAAGTGSFTWTLKEGDTSGSLTTVSASDIVGSLPSGTIDSIANTTHEFIYTGRKRYVAINFAKTGTITQCAMFAVATLCDPMHIS